MKRRIFFGEVFLLTIKAPLWDDAQKVVSLI